jgi:putative hydrolase of the HAD superfamily
MNIVFDLGGVVFKWQPDNIIASVFEDRNIQQTVRQEIFQHADWLDLDRGTLDYELAITRGAARSGLSEKTIRRLLEQVPLHLTPIDGSFVLIEELAGLRKPVFVLSNMHFASIDHLEQEHDIWDQFAGTVISCRIKKMKPEPDIYHHLLESFDLIPEETVFIDDTEINLTAASNLGIKTIKFQDPAQCRQSLVELGCI